MTQESQTVFWGQYARLGSRLQDIVVVRGAGSSSFGAGAFGATMDMQTAHLERPSGRKHQHLPVHTVSIAIWWLLRVASYRAVGVPNATFSYPE